MNERILGWKIPDTKSDDPSSKLWSILGDEARSLRLVGDYSETDGMTRYGLPGVPLQRPLLSLIAPVPRMGISHQDHPSFLFAAAVLFISPINPETTRQIYFDFLKGDVTHQCEAGNIRDRSSGDTHYESDWADGLSACLTMLTQSIITLHAHLNANVALAQRRDAQISLAHQRITTLKEALAETQQS